MKKWGLKIPWHTSHTWYVQVSTGFNNWITLSHYYVQLLYLLNLMINWKSWILLLVNCWYVKAYNVGEYNVELYSTYSAVHTWVGTLLTVAGRHDFRLFYSTSHSTIQIIKNTGPSSWFLTKSWWCKYSRLPAQDSVHEKQIFFQQWGHANRLANFLRFLGSF